MPSAANHRGRGGRVGAGAVLLTLLLAGCNAPKEPVYEDGQGFRFVPPAGWSERVGSAAMPARASHRQPDLPLPPLGSGDNPQERLLARYDRISTGQHAWLRVTVADVPSSTPLKAYLSTRLPRRDWKRVSEEENMEVSGLPAARIAFVGRWHNQDYLCETAAVRKDNKIYLFSAALPAGDDTGREQVRQAVLGARWQ